MLVVLGWLLGNAQYIILWGNESALHEQAFLALMGVIVSIVGCYVFGAAYDDNSKRKHRRPFPRSPFGDDDEPRLARPRVDPEF